MCLKTTQSIILVKFKTYILYSVLTLRLCLHIFLLLYSLISTQLSPKWTLNGPNYKEKKKDLDHLGLIDLDITFIEDTIQSG